MGRAFALSLSLSPIEDKREGSGKGKETKKEQREGKERKTSITTAITTSNKMQF